MESVSFVEVSECCRCCMNFSDDLDNIFECFYKNFELHEILSLITGLSFAHDDGFPQSICDQCKEITMRAFDFRELCHSSESEISSLKEMEDLQQQQTVQPLDDTPNEESTKADIFTCPICQCVYESSEKLALHVISSHQVLEESPEESRVTTTNTSSGRRYACQLCSKRFESPWKLRRHLLVHRDLLDPHDLPTPPPRVHRHECGECGKRVETPSKLQRHMAVHERKTRLHGAASVNPQRPLACADCPQRFWDRTKLERHRFLHTPDFERARITHPHDHAFTCVVCLERLPTYEGCHEHMRTHRDDVTPLACKLCGRTYPKLASLIRHARLHAENATHECTHCGKRFGFGEDFVDHVLRHRGFKPHACEHTGCGKRFMKAHKLRLHQATHARQGAAKCFQCDKCDKRFAEIEYLRKHLFRHLGIKGFACELCPARFASKSALESHATTHTNEKRFRCETCDARFTKAQTLNVHMKIHTKEKAYACEHCDMRFIASGPLKRHMRIHTLEKPYKCNYCEKAYAQSNDLMKHLKIHLGPNVYVCSMCPQSFAKYRQLKEHQMEHYKNDPSLLSDMRETEETREDEEQEGDDESFENVDEEFE